MKYIVMVMLAFAGFFSSFAQHGDTLRYDVIYRWVDEGSKYKVGHNLRFYPDDSLIIGTTAGQPEYKNGAYFNRINYDPSRYWIHNDTLTFAIRHNLIYEGIIKEHYLNLSRVEFNPDGTERSRESGNIYLALPVRNLEANLKE